MQTMEGRDFDDVPNANTPRPTYATQALPEQSPQYEASLQLDSDVDAAYARDRGSANPLPPRQTPTQQPSSYNLTQTASFQFQPHPLPLPYAQKQATPVPPQPAPLPFAEKQGTAAFTREPQVRPQPVIPFHLPEEEPPQRSRTPATYTAPSCLQQSRTTPVVQGVPDCQKPDPQLGVWTTGICDCMEDPTNGWSGNVVLAQRQKLATVPPVAQAMRA